MCTFLPGKPTLAKREPSLLLVNFLQFAGQTTSAWVYNRGSRNSNEKMEGGAVSNAGALFNYRHADVSECPIPRLSEWHVLIQSQGKRSLKYLVWKLDILSFTAFACWLQPLQDGMTSNPDHVQFLRSSMKGCRIPWASLSSPPPSSHFGYLLA